MIEMITKPRKIESGWQCDLHIIQESTTWYLPATAPGSVAEGDLQIYFEAMEDWLWKMACVKQHPPDIFENVGVKRLLKALALANLREHNRSREVDGEPTLTKQEWRQMIMDELKGV